MYIVQLVICFYPAFEPLSDSTGWEYISDNLFFDTSNLLQNSILTYIAYSTIICKNNLLTFNTFVSNFNVGVQNQTSDLIYIYFKLKPVDLLEYIDLNQCWGVSNFAIKYKLVNKGTVIYFINLW